MDTGSNQAPEYKRLLHDQQERLKELACINQTTAILKESQPVEDSLRKIVMLLPPAWQYPEFTVARICYRGKSYVTGGFLETKWRMAQDFATIDGESLTIEVYYTIEFREESEEIGRAHV